jgi:hypothetical protein
VADSRRVVAAPSRSQLLAIYLNDHLAGATSGVALAGRIARNHAGTDAAVELRRLADDVAEDRATLIAIMSRLGVRPASYKVGLAWLAERVARLKPNGQLVGKSPLSSLVELEAMQLGVAGKAAGWRALRELADGNDRIDNDELNQLITRADEQSALLERLRLRAAVQALGA